MRSSVLAARFLPAAVFATWSLGAAAAPVLRVQVDQRGDFVLFGNTQGYDCAAGTPLPVVGTVGACGLDTADSAPDVYWRADSPAAGQAEASTAITSAQARSTAVLAIPAGAHVTHAFLYWGAQSVAAADTTVTLERPGTFSREVTALSSATSSALSYQSVADVTALVTEQGVGAYRVSGIDGPTLANQNMNTQFAGWWMAVFYENAGEPLRSLALFDGLDAVTNGSNQNVTLSGFLVPNAFTGAKLGVATWEGDSTITGDQLFFNGGAPLSDASNPADNFFNSTRSTLGVPVSAAGDLPQLTGTAGSLSGLDLDVVDVTAKLTAGQTTSTIQATSTGDSYFLAGFVTSIPTFRPDFTGASKTATDLNGGALLAGDVIEYAIVVKNFGNDTSVQTVLTDALPAGVSYLPGSLQTTSGALTDAAADDVGDYNPATRTITVRLGTGAGPTQGGSIPPGGSTTVTFRVTVLADAVTFANQASISAGGLLGAPVASTPTDGNGAEAGSTPTTSVVDACDQHVGCAAPAPVCDTTAHPYTCVECTTDANCSGLTRTCDVASHSCVCVPTGVEICDGLDNDCNGQVDETFPAVCVQCIDDTTCGAADSGHVCNGGICGEGCRGEDGNGCPVGFECSSTTADLGACTEVVSSSSSSSSSSSGSSSGSSSSSGSTSSSSGSTSSSASSSSGSSGGSSSGQSTSGNAASSTSGGEGDLGIDGATGGGCSSTPSEGSSAAWWTVGALGLLVARRRRAA